MCAPDPIPRIRRPGTGCRPWPVASPLVAAQHDPEARAYYQRKLSEGKRHNAAVICVARRRCNIILAMLKTQTPYQQPHPENLPQAA